MIRGRTWRREFASPLSLLQEELNRVLAHYRNLATAVSPSAAEPTDLEPSAWVPAIDMVELPTEVRLWIDLPGIDPESIDLSMTGNVLDIRGERKAPPSDPNTTREHVLERPVGPFHRLISLPNDVDSESIAAETKNGVLEIRLPKAQAARPRTIPIRTT